MSGHTPGPWRVDPVNPGDVNGPDGKDVAVAVHAGMVAIEISGAEPTLANILRPEAEANARLIAAAPTTAEALAGMVRMYAKREAAPNDAMLPEAEQPVEVRAAMRALADAGVTL